MEEVRIECVAEILEELGIKATEGQIKTIAEDYALHLEMEREMSSHQFEGNSLSCSKCGELKSVLIKKDKEITVYQNGVKKRRNASNVWLDGDDVRYE